MSQRIELHPASEVIVRGFVDGAHRYTARSSVSRGWVVSVIGSVWERDIGADLTKSAALQLIHDHARVAE